MRSDKVLCVIDAQNDFITGALGSPEAEAALPYIKAKIEKYRDAGLPVYFAYDEHGERDSGAVEDSVLPVHCVGGTDGAKIASGLYVDETILFKGCFGTDSWKERFLETILYPTEIELVGFRTDVCVLTNALILRTQYPKVPVRIDAECCAGTNPGLHEKALDVMESCLIDVVNRSKGGGRDV